MDSYRGGRGAGSGGLGSVAVAVSRSLGAGAAAHPVQPASILPALPTAVAPPCPLTPEKCPATLPLLPPSTSTAPLLPPPESPALLRTTLELFTLAAAQASTYTATQTLLRDLLLLLDALTYWSAVTGGPTPPTGPPQGGTTTPIAATVTPPTEPLAASTLSAPWLPP